MVPASQEKADYFSFCLNPRERGRCVLGFPDVLRGRLPLFRLCSLNEGQNNFQVLSFLLSIAVFSHNHTPSHLAAQAQLYPKLAFIL